MRAPGFSSPYFWWSPCWSSFLSFLCCCSSSFCILCPFLIGPSVFAWVYIHVHTITVKWTIIADLAMCSYGTLYWIRLDKSSINVLSCVDIFCSKYQIHRISHTRLHPWCDFAMKNPFLENQSTIAYVYMFFLFQKLPQRMSVFLGWPRKMSKFHISTYWTSISGFGLYCPALKPVNNSFKRFQ